MALRVVAENGNRISLGQAFARQLPLLSGSITIDALSALITGNRQRVFELASRTRVVAA
jgi:uncharacterized RDD family membrane protein YckC